MLFDVPSEHQNFAALTNNDITFMDRRLPVRLEVRAGVRIANFTFPVHRKVSRSDIKRILRSLRVHPTVNQLKRLGEMWMVGVQLIGIVTLNCGRLIEFPSAWRKHSRGDRRLLHP